jgi:SP family myo-inositol transporter-like MFS transporter 13
MDASTTRMNDNNTGNGSSNGNNGSPQPPSYQQPQHNNSDSTGSINYSSASSDQQEQEHEVENGNEYKHGNGNGSDTDVIPVHSMNPHHDGARYWYHYVYVSSSRWTVSQKMNFLTAMAAIGGFLFGYDTGVISGAMLPLKRDFNLTPAQEETVVTSTVVAAFIFSLIGGSLNNQFGRRCSILFAAATFTIGSLILACSWSFGSLIVGRLVVGVGIGVASLTTPVYISEMAKPSLRGKLVTMNALLIPFGQFSAGMVDGMFSSTHEGWRYMLGLACVPSIIMLCGFTILPESPRWLASKGHMEEARRILQQYRDTPQEANHEMQDIIQSLQDVAHHEQGQHNINTCNSNNNNKSSEAAQNPANDEDEVFEQQQPLRIAQTSEDNGGAQASHNINNDNEESFVRRLKTMFDDAPTRRALRVGCGLMLFQQLAGINTVMYYAASIFEMSGNFSETQSIWLSGFTALAQVVGVAFSIYFVERIGRRPLVLASLGAVTLCLACLGFSFYYDRVSSAPVTLVPPQDEDTCGSQPAMVWSGMTRYCYDCLDIPGCGFCGRVCAQGDTTGPFAADVCPSDNSSVWSMEACPTTSEFAGWTSVVLMFLYLLTFGIGMGGLPWTINSEIYPLQHRSLATSISTATNWFSNIVVSATFLSISSPSSLTVYGAFWVYGCVALLGFVFIYLTLPETKGLSLEDIEHLFQRERDTNTNNTNTDHHRLTTIQDMPSSTGSSNGNISNDCEDLIRVDNDGGARIENATLT